MQTKSAFMISLLMPTNKGSGAYNSGEYYQNVYIPNPMNLKLSRFWMTNYYKVICKIFPKFKQLKTQKILEIGSGFGGFINLLSTLGYHHLTASDVCKNIYIPKNDYPFKIIDIEKYKSPKKYKAIIALDVMEHINHTTVAVKNINKLLTDQGYFIFCVPYPLKKHLADPYHTNMHYPNFYTNRLYRQGFKLIDFKTVSFIPFVWRFGLHLSYPGIISSRLFITETFFVFQKK